MDHPPIWEVLLASFPPQVVLSIDQLDHLTARGLGSKRECPKGQEVEAADFLSPGLRNWHSISSSVFCRSKGEGTQTSSLYERNAKEFRGHVLKLPQVICLKHLSSNLFLFCWEYIFLPSMAFKLRWHRKKMYKLLDELCFDLEIAAPPFISPEQIASAVFQLENQNVGQHDFYSSVILKGQTIYPIFPLAQLPDLICSLHNGILAGPFSK